MGTSVGLTFPSPGGNGGNSAQATLSCEVENLQTWPPGHSFGQPQSAIVLTVRLDNNHGTEEAWLRPGCSLPPA